MASGIDRIDRRILAVLQEDCTMPVAEIGRRVGLSTTPCWRRIQKLEEEGVIRRRVALLDPKKVRAGVTVFVAVRTSQHSEDWLERFAEVVTEFPEVVEFYRMSGEVDYLLRVVVPDIEQLRHLLQEADRQDRPGRRVVELRHGADQIHHRPAARLRRQGGVRAGSRRRLTSPEPGDQA
jgi:Lrp/AsnC family transcriptional regulator